MLIGVVVVVEVRNLRFLWLWSLRKGEAAILDVRRVTNLVDLALVSRGRTLLLRTVAMLTAMVLRLNDPGSGSGLT